MWNFFSGKPKYTTDVYPTDLDTTSLALATLGCDSTLVHSILDEMLRYRDEDGILQACVPHAYCDKSRPRVDAVIALNTIILFYMHGRGSDVPETTEWVQDILLNRAYIRGTRYYPCAEWFLYYLWRLLSKSNDPALKEKFEGPLKVRTAERIGADGDAFCLAMRLLVCNAFGITNIPDREKLLSLQWEDGGWEPSNMYVFPGAGKRVGNRGTTTAFATKALQGFPGSCGFTL